MSSRNPDPRPAAVPEQGIRPWQRGLRWGALALVPLLVAGVLVAAFSGLADGLGRVPALIVNNDEMVETTTADGETQIVLAGRLLVTELTSSEDETFDWQLSSTEQAEEALASGGAYVVLTIPEDFSESVLSLSGDDPTQAQLGVITDDSHSYLAGALTESLADGMAKTFGTELTEQYIAGIYEGISGVGGAFEDAADGAGQLADGIDGLGDGLGQLADGMASAADGAGQYAAGVREFRAGLKQLSDGVGTLADQTKNLGDLGDGLAQYLTAVDGAGQGYLDVVDDVLDTPGLSVEEITALTTLKMTLQGVSPSTDALVAGANGLGGLSDGIQDLDDGMTEIYRGSAALRDGADDLASGLDELAAGTADAAEGTTQLGDGAHELADGLAQGAGEVPSYTDDEIENAAMVAANPVGVTVTRENLIENGTQGLLALFLPIGVWVGALAVSALGGGVRRSALASTAGSGRLLVGDALRQASITVPGALLLGLVIPPIAGVGLAGTLGLAGLAVLSALVFTALHQLLALLLGRAGGAVVSVLLLVLQLASSGGLYPVQVLGEPFASISPLMPLSHAVTAAQGILAQGSATLIVPALLALAAFGAVALGASAVVVTRRRTAKALGMLPRYA